MDRDLIETAFVSGRLGQAIYRVDEDLYAVEVGGTPRPASPAELLEVQRPGTEYLLLHQRTTNQIQDELRKLVRHYNALFLVLSLMDMDASLSARVLAAQAAEELLADNEEKEFVARRLLSFPLPVQIRSHRHQIVSPWAEFEHVKPLLSEVFELQPIIDELRAAWIRALDSQSIDETTKSSLEAVLSSSGFFAESARSIGAGDHYRFNSAVVKQATDPETLTELRAAQTLLTAFRSEVHSKFFVGHKRAVQKPLKLRKGERPPRVQRENEGDAISELIEGIDIGGDKPRRYVGALEAKARVDKQINAIREALFAGKNSTAEEYLKDLLAFQLGHGDREHAAMSLCALTAIALDANQFNMADRLSEYATKLTSEDKVVYTSRAEVFKQRGHFDAALTAYEEAIVRFGQDRWALNGYADVLKEKGLFEEAIIRYRQIQKDFPDDPVAFNGEVGVLRAKGEYRIALSLALKFTKRFEYDPVTRTTLAGCLSALGKYDDALRQYEVAISLKWAEIRTHRGYLNTLRESGRLEAALRHADVVLNKFPQAYPILLVKANLLRGAGRLNEAEALYQGLIDLYPTYAPARLGIAAIRVLQNKDKEAQESLPEEDMESEIDWYGFRIKALSYAGSGDYGRAAPRLSFGLGRCPWLRERSKLQTALGLVELYRGDTAKSIGILNKNIDQLEARDQQIRLVLLAHAHADRGAADVASILMGRLSVSREPSLLATRSSIISAYKLPVRVSQRAYDDFGQVRTQELSLAMAA